MKARILILLMIVSVAGCVAPIDLKYPGQSGILVVDGWITNQPGPYTIKLSRSIAYDNSKPLKVYTIPEKNAKLSIVDDFGNSEVLTETSTPGSYKTNTITGVVGRSYQIKIETGGKKYVSDMDRMQDVPDIANLEAKYQISEVLYINANGAARTQKKEDFGIYVTINDPVDEENYYRWQADGIFEYYSVDDFLPTHCWAPQQGRIEPALTLTSDLYFNGQSNTVYIGLIAYDRPTYYLIHLNQQSLTAEAFKFLRQLRDQQLSTGTLFDPPPTTIAGNIRNESDSQEVVLGYFGATAIKKKNLLINRFEESGFVTPSRYMAPLRGDCRLQQLQGTNIKPDGFIR